MSRAAQPARTQPPSRVRLIGLAAWRGVGELYNSDGLTHAAAIAYYALLSLFPIILLGLSVLGEMTTDTADRDAVVRFAFRYFPRQFAFIQGQLDAFRETPVTFGFWGVVALVWAALGVFALIAAATAAVITFATRAGLAARHEVIEVLHHSGAEAPFIAVSQEQARLLPGLNVVSIVPHAVDTDRFVFNASPEDYLLFIGRFTPGKGPVEAIGLAKRLGLRLLMAAARDRYYHEAVEPLVDGEQIVYVGEVNFDEKVRLYQGARALLYPVQEGEPFGLVLAEAMSCGTPQADVHAVVAVEGAAPVDVTVTAVARQANDQARVSDAATTTPS